MINKILEALQSKTFTAELYDNGWEGQTVNNLLCLGDVKVVIEQILGKPQPVKKCGTCASYNGEIGDRMQFCDEFEQDVSEEHLCCYWTTKPKDECDFCVNQLSVSAQYCDAEMYYHEESKYNVTIDTEHNDSVNYKFTYCPFCGRKIKED